MRLAWLVLVGWVLFVLALAALAVIAVVGCVNTARDHWRFGREL